MTISKPHRKYTNLREQRSGAEISLYSQELLLAKPTHRVEYSVAYKRHLRGFVDQYNSETADILHLRGEFHLRVKPVCPRILHYEVRSLTI